MRIRPARHRLLAEPGFTMMELVVLIIVLGIVSLVIIGNMGSIGAAPINQAEALAAHLRYTKTQAMKSGAEWGLACQSNACWLYSGTDSSATPVQLPGETTATINTTANEATCTDFDIYFDSFGIPYAESSNTKLSSDLTITVAASADAGRTQTITVTAETGYVP